MFILSGANPPVMPIEIGIPNYSKGETHTLLRVELTIHPWLSSDSVLRLYKRLQRIVVGPRNRAPTKASLEFFDFVSRMRHEGRSFREAMESWVQSRPRERRRYRKRDVSALSRFTNQYRDIERQVLRPFGRPGNKGVSL
jgi:hypothetical protein